MLKNGRMKHKILILLLLSGQLTVASGQLTLEECRQRALRENHGLKRAEERVAEAKAMEKVALWQMLPKLSANGTYLWMDRQIELLSESQKERLRNMGTTAQEDINRYVHSQLDQLPVGGTAVGDWVAGVLSGMPLAGALNGVGDEVVRSLETDTRNVVAGAVTVTQPIYMGGKLRALYRTASLMAQLGGVEMDKKREETLIAVDEAYWQVVSVQHKKELAEQYAALLDTLNSNVEKMVEAEVATKGDLTKVRVKLNEAQMNLTKATNGLALAKMLLAQRCGMPLDTVFEVRSGRSSGISSNSSISSHNLDSVYERRAEMRMLRISDSVAQQGVRMARAGLLPNIAATGGYLMTSPNVFNGFENALSGTLMAGVVVNIPILHPGAIYSLKAAKHRKREVELQMSEAQEMIALQVNKLTYEHELAHKKLAQATSNLANAEENLKLADESFKAGMASSSDLMAAQTVWLQAKGEVLDAEIEIEMSRLYLNQALGF